MQKNIAKIKFLLILPSIKFSIHSMNKSLIILFLLSFFCLYGFSQQTTPISDEDQAEINRHEEMVEYYLNNEEYSDAVASLNNIALIYWDNNRGDRAINYFFEAISIYERLDDLNNIQKVYSNVALIYLDMEELRRAREYFEKCLETRREMGNRHLIASGMVDLAYVLSLQGQYQEAEDYLLNAENIAIADNYQSLLLNIYNQLSKNYNNLGIVAKADEYRQKYLTHQEQLSTETLREEFEERETRSQIEIRRAELERRERELEMEARQLAYEVEQDSISRVMEAKEDSLQIAEARDSIAQQEMERLQLDRELQTAELEKQEEQQRTQRIIITFATGALVIGTFLLIILFRNFRAKQRANKELEATNKEIESKSKQLQEAYYKIEDQNLKITHSINYAQDIQKALLPPRETLKEYLPESFIFFKPLHTVSGDFYWFKEIHENSHKKPKEKKKAEKALAYREEDNFNKNISNGGGNNNFLPIDGDKFIVAAVDCTGHGVPGAFMSMIGYNLLDEITHYGITHSNKILTNLHKGIRRTLKQEEGGNRDGMDLSLCVINKEEKTLEFSGAQTHMIYIQNGEAKVIKGDRMSVGGVQKEEERNFSKNIIKVNEPTWVYIFSDGYIDQFGGPNNRKLLLKNFKNLLLDIHKEPMDKQEQMLKDYFLEWKKDEDQIDDVIVIGFKLGNNEA